MLSEEEIQHIAKLARIRFAENELAAFQKEFEAILGFVGKLNEVDTKDVAPTAQVGRLSTVVREDTGGNIANSDQQVKLLTQAPQRDGNYVKVKAVFEA